MACSLPPSPRLLATNACLQLQKDSWTALPTFRFPPPVPPSSCGEVEALQGSSSPHTYPEGKTELMYSRA